MDIIPRVYGIVAVTLTAWGLAGAAQAAGEPPPSGGEAAFQRADINKDGRLSKDEASQLPAIAARFEELDRNKDGFLSLEEFMTGYTAKRE